MSSIGPVSSLPVSFAAPPAKAAASPPQRQPAQAGPSDRDGGNDGRALDKVV